MSSKNSSGNSHDLALRLHDRFDIDEINELQKILSGKLKFSPEELREIMKQFQVYFKDEDFDTLFRKMNTNRDNKCNWDEFISFLILGFQLDDPKSRKVNLNFPIEGMPQIKRLRHRYPIIKILFSPAVNPDRTINQSDGCYLTIDKAGNINYSSASFEYQRTGQSKNPFYKVATTWILDCVALSDVAIVCTSSSERDLRFYDTAAGGFYLRIVISSIPFAVNSMNYWFHQSLAYPCKLILGDLGGNVFMLEFNAYLRGPFQSTPGKAFIHLKWIDLLAGKIPLITITQYIKLHKDIIRHVEYCEYLNAIISASSCAPVKAGKLPDPGLIISDLGVQKTQTKIRMTKGTNIFAFCEYNELIATGGQDCILRLWNYIVPRKPIAILPGHASGITYIFFQDEGTKVYTIDRTRIIKVWDVVNQSLLQTYIRFQPVITDRCDISALYDDRTRQLTIGALKIASVHCCPLLELKLTDGYTHSKTISVCIYNELFKTIVTCGLDSFIIVWDPWTGRRLSMIQNAHTQVKNGEIIRIQITAGCFDPKMQLLLTGARNGTLKIWNFNTGACIRNLAIEDMCEVTSVFWLHERILAAGWNKHVTEFSDAKNDVHGSGKLWDKCHVDDILGCAIKKPEAMATSSYAGELVLWKLETGQPYRRYNVQTPELRIKITYEGIRAAPPPEISNKRGNQSISSKSITAQSENRPSIFIRAHKNDNAKGDLTFDRETRRVTIVKVPRKLAIQQSLAVQTLLFLDQRKNQPNVGTLFVAIEDGCIQVYSHHLLGGYIKSFMAVHIAGDSVVSMKTNKKNEMAHINMPELRLKFPFLTKDIWLTRAKRTVVNNPNIPMLLNSYKAHMKAVTTINYIDDTELIVTSSPDYSARLWTIGGRYIGTLGSPIKWVHIIPGETLGDDYPHRMPADIKRNISFTSFKVLSGGIQEIDVHRVISQQKESMNQDKDDNNNVENDQTNEELNTIKKKLITAKLGKRLLGNDLTLPDQHSHHEKPIFDNSLSHVGVYTHVSVIESEDIPMPGVPNLIVKTDKFECLNQLK